jgi:hypothetical protein
LRILPVDLRHREYRPEPSNRQLGVKAAGQPRADSTPVSWKAGVGKLVAGGFEDIMEK